MIGNVETVFPGPDCQADTYAYVYATGDDCEEERELRDLKGICRTHNEKFVFFMCNLYLQRPHEMVETLVHEASHHAVAYTLDVCADGQLPDEKDCMEKGSSVAYGRPDCEALATDYPDTAILNADNYCFYVQDVTKDKWDLGVPEQGPEGKPLADPHGKHSCRGLAKAKCHDLKDGCLWTPTPGKGSWRSWCQPRK